jgi:hypothetical protein
MTLTHELSRIRVQYVLHTFLARLLLTLSHLSLEVTRPSEASQTLLAYKTCFRGTRYSRTARGRPLISYSTLMTLEVTRSEFTWL